MLLSGKVVWRLSGDELLGEDELEPFEEKLSDSSSDDESELSGEELSDSKALPESGTSSEDEWELALASRSRLVTVGE